MMRRDVVSLYEERTTRSRQAFKRSQQRIPGGVQGNIKFFQPYPLTFRKAAGAWLTDVDDNLYVDYLLSFGALILGHGHPSVRAAVEQVWDTYGTSSFGVPHALETEMAELITDLFPSVEQLRFTNSGLEATLLAIRLGMAFTGRSHIAKFDGHYHGGHEQVLISTETRPTQGTAQTAESATHQTSAHLTATPESKGLPDYYVEHTVVLPFNDLPACEAILWENRAKVGVVILEPLQSGYIPATREFIHGLRELTQRLDMVLVFDEVKTGFRVALGGAQEYYGVRADLTALGKILGGGFPVGAVGGRADILELASPLRSSNPQDVVFHSGTFNGNPISLAAGMATIRFLQEENQFPKIVDTAHQLRAGIESAGAAHGFKVQTVGVGALFNFQVNADQPGESPPSSRHLRETLDFLLMSQGVFSKPLNRYSLSAAHGDAEIQHTLRAFKLSFAALNEVQSP